MAGVELVDITKRYPGDVRAVDGLSLAVADRELLVLLGPSGCGKSTTLRIIAGIESPTTGDIYIGARRVNDVPPGQRDIAMVFQDYALYPHMTVYDNLAFGLRRRRMPRRQIDARIHATARTLAIEPLLHRKPGQISGGQRQRVALGRAIVRDPAVFLLDEPLSNLDAQLRVNTRSELKALQKQLATTTVHVTHDQEEAMILGDRIAVMSEGVIQQRGRPLTVYQHPANRFVAGFLGNPTMNFLDGYLELEPAGITFLSQQRVVPLPANFRPRLTRYANQPVVLGLRPEAFTLNSPTASNTPKASFTGHVEDVQPIGPVIHATVRTRMGHLLQARFESATLAPGRPVELGFDPADAYLFEPGPYGRNLTDSTPAPGDSDDA